MAMFEIHAVDEQIKALPTVDTASGSVATFDTDLTENLIEVKCQILAQQGGSGTPSPSNPRPITTFSEMNVSATGKNFYNINNQTVTAINTYCTMYVPFNSNITFSTDIAQTGLYAHYYDNGNLVEIAHIYNSRSLTFNTGNHNYIRLMTYNEGTQATEFQAEFGTTATTYEPFNGTTANIHFGQTVANGVLDVTTGKLEITHKVYDLSTETATLTGNQRAWRYAFSDIKKTTLSSEVPSFICEQYRAVSANAFNYVLGTSYQQLNSIFVKFVNEDIQNQPQGKIVIELATPIEIQLDSITLQALLNENNIWCDTGDTNVKFLLTVGKKIGA